MAEITVVLMALNKIAKAVIFLMIAKLDFKIDAILSQNQRLILFIAQGNWTHAWPCYFTIKAQYFAVSAMFPGGFGWVDVYVTDAQTQRLQGRILRKSGIFQIFLVNLSRVPRRKKLS